MNEIAQMFDSLRLELRTKFPIGGTCHVARTSTYKVAGVVTRYLTGRVEGYLFETGETGKTPGLYVRVRINKGSHNIPVEQLQRGPAPAKEQPGK